MNLHSPDPPAASGHRRPQNNCHSLLVIGHRSLAIAHWSLHPGAPAGVPRIRVIRLESLPRARRGGSRHPARKPIRFAIADARRTHKSVCPLLPECAEGHRSSLPIAPGIVDCDSLAVFSWCSQAITSMLRKRPQALWPRSRNITLLTEIEMPP